MVGVYKTPRNGWVSKPLVMTRVCKTPGNFISFFITRIVPAENKQDKLGTSVTLPM